MIVKGEWSVTREPPVDDIDRGQDDMHCPKIEVPGYNMRTASCLERRSGSSSYCRNIHCETGDKVRIRHGLKPVNRKVGKTKQIAIPIGRHCRICKERTAMPAGQWKQVVPKTDVPICQLCHNRRRLDYLSHRLLVEKMSESCANTVRSEIKATEKKIRRRLSVEARKGIDFTGGTR